MALPEVTLTDREIYEALLLRSDGKTIANRSQKKLQKSNALNLGRTLFKEQVDFILDPSRRKAAICSRRSGKSYAAGRYLLKEALEDEGCIHRPYTGSCQTNPMELPERSQSAVSVKH